MEAAAFGGIIGWAQGLWPTAEKKEEGQAEFQSPSFGMKVIGTFKS